MSRPYSNYQDPYQQQGTAYDTQGNHAHNPSYSYDEQAPYGDAPQYSYHEPISTPEYPPVGSSEKVLEHGDPESLGQIGGTQRERPGRVGIAQPQSSWAQMGPPPRSTGILRMWRKDERGKQWFRGGGVRSFFRMFCCCITITLILIISILLSILLFIRPPSVSLNSVTVDTLSLAITPSNGFSIKINLGITVANPNWFNADFKEISATIRYPGNNTNTFGGGAVYNTDFVGYTSSTFDFPLTLNYSTALDPNEVILDDLMSKCGVSTSTVSDITIDYTLNLKLKILGVTIDPTVDSSASFECPISASDIESIIGGT